MLKYLVWVSQSWLEMLSMLHYKTPSFVGTIDPGIEQVSQTVV